MVLVALLACQTGPADSEEDTATVDPATVELAGACPAAERLGGFVVESNPSFSAVDGSVLDGVIPVTVLTEVASQDGCRLLRRENPFCDPGCDPDETCDLGGTCVAYPTGLDLGAISVTGLAQAVTMSPTAPGNTYYDTTLPTPAYGVGQLVQLGSDGGALDPLLLHGVGFETFDLGEEAWAFSAGSPFAVTWTPPAAVPHRATVQLTVNVDQHGVTPLFLSCDFADDGAGEVPVDLVDAFLSAGQSGYPNGRLERLTADHQGVTGGCVDFEVRWAVVPTEVSVDGHTPCDNPTDCPPGQTCDTETQTCV